MPQMRRKPDGGVLGTATTANGGYYRFDNLTAGDYVVVIPASQFSGVLSGYWSSGTTISAGGALTETVAPDPDNDVDSDDNGTRQSAGPFSGAVISNAVTLGPGFSEPTGETDLFGGQGALDGRANMTVDFGFYRQQIGDLVFVDGNGDGTFDAGDPCFKMRSCSCIRATVPRSTWDLMASWEQPMTRQAG